MKLVLSGGKFIINEKCGLFLIDVGKSEIR